MSQRVLLIGTARSNRLRWSRADSLRELEALVASAGGVAVGQLIQVRSRPDPATLVGRGLVKTLAAQLRAQRVELVVFDDELSPTQQRNLEDELGVRVIDRAAVILDIFALHARTAEAKIQVELAQLEYRRSRLVGLGGELSRLGGGIGTRGPGETKLEVDRRRIIERIAVLRRSLARVERERQTQRERRTSQYRVVLVGYTSAGKSTLLNALTGAAVRVSESLFSTLDASTRMLKLTPRIKVLLTDTVGFIRDLPPQLVASFRSTLAEVRDANLILHVVDASDEQLDRRIDSVNDTLEQIGAAGRDVLMVFTKSDRLVDPAAGGRLERFWPGALLVSGRTGAGLDRLRAEITERVRRTMVTRRFQMPLGRGDVVSILRRAGDVNSETVMGDCLVVDVTGFQADLARAEKEIGRRLASLSGRGRAENSLDETVFGQSSFK